MTNPFEIPLETNDTTRIIVTTLNSQWTILGNKFMREPLRGPREELVTIDGAGKDDVWHAHQGVWSGFNVAGEQYVRILPAGRPVHFHGLVSSQVVDITHEAL